MSQITFRLSLGFLCFLLFHIKTFSQTVQISGEQKKWHKITLSLDGPSTSELATPNPFLNYRFEVVFTHIGSGELYRVPGYFGADGDAAETGATSGNKWIAHLAPSKTGTWNYQISFRTGTEVAIDSLSNAGVALAPYDGITGSFVVSDTDKTGNDFRAKGILSYIGEHYYQFQETGEYFLKFGADSPENLLAYYEFDNTKAHGGSNTRYTKGYGGYPAKGQTWPYYGDTLHHYEVHESDWNVGDPLWHSTKGKGIIGALNYLVNKGMNGISFLVMNIDGDGQDSYPYVNYNATYTPQDDRRRFDVSKLGQWEIIFEHATRKGLFMDIKTQETENDQLLDGGQLGVERKLLYRELIARFGHHLALQWNLGEENDIWNELNDPNNTYVKSYAKFFLDWDPYHHPIVIHSYTGDQDEMYDPLLGSQSVLTGPALQSNSPDIVHKESLEWIQASADSNRKWVVSTDEIGPASNGVSPDGTGNNHEQIRAQVLWGNLMAGGAGMQAYFGYAHRHHDLDCEWFGFRDRYWDYMRYAKEFFEMIPYHEMTNKNELIGNTTKSNDKYCLGKDGEVYAVYLPNGGSTNIDLTSLTGNYDIHWYDPRNGGNLQLGSKNVVAAGNTSTDLGNPPDSTNKDWVILLRNQATPLDVEILNFEVKLLKRDIELTWSTLSERQSDKFIVQRKEVGRDLWVNLGEIKAAGFSDTIITYQFVDKPLRVGNYRYRLEQLDLDGSRNYSSEIEVELESSLSLQIFPNPVIDQMNLEIQGLSLPQFQLRIWNSHGQSVYEQSLSTISIEEGLSFSVENWRAGLYFIELRSGDQHLIKPFIKH